MVAAAAAAVHHSCQAHALLRLALLLGQMLLLSQQQCRH
jgi:hypothetical protein